MQRLHSLFMGMIISTLLASGIVFDQNVLAEDLPVFVNGQSELESEQGLNGKDRLRKHQQEFLRGHCDPSGAVRPDLWQKGVEHVKQMKIAARVPLDPGGVVGVQWTQIGPAPERIIDAREFGVNGTGPNSGQVVDIAIDPRNTTDQAIYIATDDGGIWKTTDGGMSWRPKTDFMPSLSIGAVALDPGNPSIVYAGTGNLLDSGGVVNIFTKGVGIYKSIDGGETWSVLNPGSIFTNIGISRIVFPASNILLVGTNRGLFRSIDGGLHFGNNMPTFDNGQPVLTGGNISDLDLDTASPSIVYASVQGQGIFKSDDGGATFPTNGNVFTRDRGAPEVLDFIAFATTRGCTRATREERWVSLGQMTGVRAGSLCSAALER